MCRQISMKSDLELVRGFRIKKQEHELLNKYGPISEGTKSYIKFLEKELNGKWGTKRTISLVLQLSKNYLSEYGGEELIKRCGNNKNFYHLDSLAIIIRKRLADGRLEPLTSERIERLEREIAARRKRGNK